MLFRSVGYGDISPVTPWGRAMTSVLALLGIGIFAIPAALLASAFSDELVKDRDALKANLFQILKDGKIEAKETQFIRDEAKRLLQRPDLPSDLRQRLQAWTRLR